MVDYAYYTGVYCGSVIPADKFPYYERKASAYVDAETFGHIDKNNIPNEVKEAVCSAAEECYRVCENKAVSDGVTSEKVGDYSVTYGGTLTDRDSAEKSMNAAVKIYLGNTGLMYRGDD